MNDFEGMTEQTTKILLDWQVAGKKGKGHSRLGWVKTENPASSRSNELTIAHRDILLRKYWKSTIVFPNRTGISRGLMRNQNVTTNCVLSLFLGRYLWHLFYLVSGSLPEWLSSCILTVLRLPLIANLTFSWKTGRDSGVGGGVEGINRGKVSLLSISHLPKCLYSLLMYTHRIKRLEGWYRPNASNTVIFGW